MNHDRDLMPVLRGWIVADERDLPEPVRTAVMATIAAVPQRRRRWFRPWRSLTARPLQLRTAVTVGLLLTLSTLLAAAWLLPFAGSTPKPTRIVNGWIAFSSQPHAGQVMETDIHRGGDIYLAHDRDDLRMLVSRGPDMDTNVCPTFSPDGTRLAYGERTDAATAVVILDLAADGSIMHTSRLPLETPVAQAPCPRWSADATRIGALEGDTIIIRGLDGSILEAADGDPTLADFPDPGPLVSLEPLVSPSGELSVRSGESGVVVSPVDGSPDRIIHREPWGIWGWSPDSRKVLLARDPGMALQLRAVSVHEPFTVEVIAKDIPTNGARSRSGRRDVSWQTLLE